MALPARRRSHLRGSTPASLVAARRYCPHRWHSFCFSWAATVIGAAMVIRAVGAAIFAAATTDDRPQRRLANRPCGAHNERSAVMRIGSLTLDLNLVTILTLIALVLSVIEVIRTWGVVTRPLAFAVLVLVVLQLLWLLGLIGLPGAAEFRNLNIWLAIV